MGTQQQERVVMAAQRPRTHSRLQEPREPYHHRTADNSAWPGILHTMGVEAPGPGRCHRTLQVAGVLIAHNTHHPNEAAVVGNTTVAAVDVAVVVHAAAGHHHHPPSID